jgi:hypothetical protein
MKTLQKNWKTTLAGAIVALTGLAVSMGWITPQEAAGIGTVAGAFGLVSAKDGNVTGGTKQQ